MFFVSGLNTLVQTTLGDRLPIIQGGSFSYLPPAFAIIAQIQASGNFASDYERFEATMNALQGALICAAFVQVPCNITLPIFICRSASYPHSAQHHMQTEMP
jgi:nucleobase transporter 1/2